MTIVFGANSFYFRLSAKFDIYCVSIKYGIPLVVVKKEMNDYPVVCAAVAIQSVFGIKIQLKWWIAVFVQKLLNILYCVHIKAIQNRAVIPICPVTLYD